MILQNHPEISCSEKTLYNYIDSGSLSAKNIDLLKRLSIKYGLHITLNSRMRQYMRDVLTKSFRHS